MWLFNYQIVTVLLCMHIINYNNQLCTADETTLPKDILRPQFSGNCDVVDADDICNSRSRRDLWIAGFPRIERPSDELDKTNPLSFDYVTPFI